MLSYIVKNNSAPDKDLNSSLQFRTTCEHLDIIFVVQEPKVLGGKDKKIMMARLVSTMSKKLCRFLIDDGNDPNEFTRDVLNGCLADNQIAECKIDSCPIQELDNWIGEECCYKLKHNLPSQCVRSNKVVALFYDQPDLLDEFTRFKMSSQNITRLTIFFYEGLSVEHLDTDKDDKTMKLHKEQRKRSEKESRNMWNCDQDYKETAPDTNMDMHHIEKRKSACEVEDFGVHSDLTPYGDKDALKM